MAVIQCSGEAVANIMRHAAQICSPSRRDARRLDTGLRPKRLRSVEYISLVHGKKTCHSISSHGHYPYM